MRKIVFIAANEYIPWGGSEFCWGEAAKKFAQHKTMVSISAKEWGLPVKQIEYLRSIGCQIFLRKPPSFMDRISQKLFSRPEYVSDHVRTIGLGADLIVVSQGNNIDGIHWMEGAKANGYKYAVISQAAAEEWWPSDELAERLARAYESAAGAYFVSEHNLALSRRQFGTPLSHGRVIRNPFNVRYDARPPWPGDPSDGLSLACVARLDIRQKGQDLLIEVLSLPHWRERNVRVAFVGDGVNARGLRHMVEGLKLTGIEFLGFVNDIEDLWSKHHALVLPSRYEGLPLAIVEALLCGRPCIVTDIAGNGELVRDGVTGFLAKAPTVELLDHALNRAWENRSRLMEMGRTAAATVRESVPMDPAEDFFRDLANLVDLPTGNGMPGSPPNNANPFRQKSV